MKTRAEKIIAALQASMREGARVECESIAGPRGWTIANRPLWNFDKLNYRVSLPCGGKREPITAKDWEGQAVVWVRLSGQADRNLLVLSVYDYGFNTVGQNYEWADDERLEYSFDRVKWHPFVREVSGGWQVVASTEES